MDKNQNQRKSEEVLLSGASLQDLLFLYMTHTWPPITFQHLEMQARRPFSPCSYVCVPLWACVHSSERITTITWRELYNCSLWSHFPQRTFWSFLFLFLPCLTCFNVKWLTLNHQALLLSNILQCIYFLHCLGKLFLDLENVFESGFYIMPGSF